MNPDNALIEFILATIGVIFIADTFFYHLFKKTISGKIGDFSRKYPLAFFSAIIVLVVHFWTCKDKNNE